MDVKSLAKKAVAELTHKAPKLADKAKTEVVGALNKAKAAHAKYKDDRDYSALPPRVTDQLNIKDMEETVSLWEQKAGLGTVRPEQIDADRWIDLYCMEFKGSEAVEKEEAKLGKVGVVGLYRFFKAAINDNKDNCVSQDLADFYNQCGELNDCTLELLKDLKNLGVDFSNVDMNKKIAQFDDGLSNTVDLICAGLVPADSIDLEAAKKAARRQADELSVSMTVRTAMRVTTEFQISQIEYYRDHPKELAKRIKQDAEFKAEMDELSARINEAKAKLGIDDDDDKPKRRSPGSNMGKTLH